jgi:chromosome segregation ATPase
MNYNKLNELTKSFLINEGNQPSVHSYIQSIEEALSTLNPKTKSDARRIEVARKHLREVRRQTRRLEESVSNLEEKLKLLEESNEK